MDTPYPYQTLSDSHGKEQKVVCVQGLGYVGAATCVAIATAQDESKGPLYQVIGVDLPTERGQKRVQSLEKGLFPFKHRDSKLTQTLKNVKTSKNLAATCDERAFEQADIIVVAVPFEVRLKPHPKLSPSGFRSAIETVGRHMRPEALIVITTTVPPGSCEKIVLPILKEALKSRKLPSDNIRLSFSYERVMPGKNYLASITHFWRVYAGNSPDAAAACERFLSSFIRVSEFPLTKLNTMREAELGKILENSYRAMTIAFMEEWGRFAEAVDIDLYKVISAIRIRPTHSNMRQPGFGVGGYCLTKDPLLAALSAQELFDRPDLTFPFSTQAVAINEQMPLVGLYKIRDFFDGSLKGKKLLLLGVSYRQDVGDTRYAPAQIFVEAAQREGATVRCHDPLVEYWTELDIRPHQELPSPKEFDAIIFSVAHREYADIDFKSWLGSHHPLILDTGNILSETQRNNIKSQGSRLIFIGRGSDI